MTKIENTAKGKYWDVGITLVSGCSNVSDSCKHCWSAGFAHRFRNNPFYTGLTDEKGCWNGHVRFNEHLLKRFERKTPTTFSIWNDLFHEGISFEQIYKTYGIIAQNQQHPVLVLTKRPEHALEFYNYYDNEVGMGYGRHIENHTIPPIPNLYLGVSVENQKTADERIPILLQIPAAVRFVSCEPLLEAIDFSSFLPYIGYKPINKKRENNVTQDERRDCLSSGNKGGVKDRQIWKDLESEKSRGKSLDTRRQYKSLQTSKSRERPRTISSDSSNGKTCSDIRPCSQTGVAALFRKDTPEYDCESQKRYQEGQSTRESGISNMEPASNSFDLRSRKPPKTAKSIGTKKLSMQINRQAGGDNTYRLCERTGASKRLSGEIQCDVSDHLVNCAGENTPEAGRSNSRLYTESPKKFFEGETRQFGTISQIIAGIETGPGARKAKTDWFRRVRDQCIAAGVPYFLKKAPDGTRLLDGKEWSQYPEVK